MDAQNTHKKNPILPESFKHLLWSYDFSKIDPEQYRSAIVANTLNFGTLKHWRWLVDFYGKDRLKGILKEVPITEVRPRTRKLAALLFGFGEFNYAPRSTH